MRSQDLRKQSPEIDPLKLSMDFTVEDLGKPQILVDDVWGDSMPGSYHLMQLSQMVSNGVYSSGGKPGLFHVTDVCDGIIQGTEGMYYSLLSREMICDMIEVHWRTQPMDGMVLVSSCDKAVPGQLMAAARLNDAPAIVALGGTQAPGPGMFTLEQVGTIYAQLRRGELAKDVFTFFQQNACPTEGSCSFMGTANTMQSMSEALGMSLPGSAVTPAYQKDVRALAEISGKRIMGMLEEGAMTRDILTKDAFENAIMVHAAIAGSLNAIMHLAAIAHETGITLHPKLWDELNREIPYLLNVRPSGKYPAVFFWYAGGVYGIISEIREFLHLDAMTVTGKTVGENLKDMENMDYFTKVRRYLKNFKVTAEDVMAPINRPIGKGALAILSGNLAPGHAAIKYSALPREMFHHVGPAVVFEQEKAAFDAVINGEIEPGSMIVLRYAGPKGLGLPEMFYLTEALASKRELDTTTALITDGRFSGASRGPCVGYLCPEAMDGGPIAVVEDGDLIELDVPNRGLNIVGVQCKKEEPETINKIIADRLSQWKPPENKYTGVLRLFTKLATPAMEGAYMKY
ncbi:dihydroxy-acid dehydratase [Methanocella paludicola SANAE]|uniref:Dihydroxy-acid dehydratase n=1 Tax=Methanocella paludicola (strain DSM 17711 / JCM 13418 / NBRC 101707 / SANAE) TaxID=304371 RepID=D1Z1H3_METPS|nr:dihydroxy-acid dehydratase [Methanocella paludicola]BAI62545.1 dihydroxy-acid dehydratase [Methanocella paludicola SANAE]